MVKLSYFSDENLERKRGDGSTVSFMWFNLQYKFTVNNGFIFPVFSYWKIPRCSTNWCCSLMKQLSLGGVLSGQKETPEPSRCFLIGSDFLPHEGEIGDCKAD